MEKLLHYAWKHRIMPLGTLRTTDGREVEVVDPGLPNNNAGPDFFNAKVKIGGTMWAGNVEIHLISSDWFRHGHDKDPQYNNTILHVAQTVDCEVRTEDGKCPPQVQLQIPDEIKAHYEELLLTMDYPRCHSIIPQVSSLKAHSWMDALLVERLKERAELVLGRLKDCTGDWQRAFFITLCRNFGFGVNGDAFEQWAKRFPLHNATKHRDDLFQTEALFLGTAGLLVPSSLPQSCREEAASDDYYLRICKEYTFLSHMFNLEAPMPYQRWRYLRMRPQNFPHIRLVQLAWMYWHSVVSLSAILEAQTIKDLHAVLEARVSDYWQTHYLFGMSSPNSEKHLTPASKNLIIINTVVPVLYAYGMQHQNQHYCDRAIELLEALKAENNYIIRQWRDCGLSVTSAADSQALVQLKREYCDKHDCLRCRFGYEYLKGQAPSLGGS